MVLRHVTLQYKAMHLLYVESSQSLFSQPGRTWQFYYCRSAGQVVARGAFRARISKAVSVTWSLKGPSPGSLWWGELLTSTEEIVVRAGCEGGARGGGRAAGSQSCSLPHLQRSVCQPAGARCL